ncbi:hypothetical protein, partial [Flavobacterium sp. LAR06]|uniref:hypothetical protein n=1 Tax=Flavobacterium sp. LAR06 TaxID=3064897 RepID=UPI0035C1675E
PSLWTSHHNTFFPENFTTDRIMLFSGILILLHPFFLFITNAPGYKNCFFLLFLILYSSNNSFENDSLGKILFGGVQLQKIGRNSEKQLLIKKLILL